VGSGSFPQLQGIRAEVAALAVIVTTLAGCVGGDLDEARHIYVSGPLTVQPHRGGAHVQTPDGDLSLAFGDVERAGVPADAAVWWTEHDQGVEFGWTVESAPATDGPLAVDLTFDAAVDVHRSGLFASLTTPETTVHLTGLAAWDAEDTTLYARFQALDAHRIRIRVDAEDAVYPVTIDPILTSSLIDLPPTGGGGRAG